MSNTLKKSFSSVLVQPPNELRIVPARFKSDREALLVDAKYNDLKTTIYSGIDFAYSLFNTAQNGGSSQAFDEYDNIIELENGWYVNFQQDVGGSIPDSLLILDADVDTPLGGEITPETTELITPEPRLERQVLEGWNASAYSTEIISGSIQLSFSIAPYSKGVICGINQANKAKCRTDYDDINYCFYSFGNQYKILENGVDIGFSAETFTDSDIFKIVIFNGLTKYYVNDILKRTVARHENYSNFRGDVSLYASNDSLINAVIEKSVVPFVGTEISKNLEFGTDSSTNNSLYGSEISLNFEQGAILNVLNGSEISLNLEIGTDSNTDSILYGSEISENFETGNTVLIIPPDVLLGSETSFNVESGYIDTGEFSINYTEPDPTFSVDGEIIIKGVINKRLYTVTFTGAADGLSDIVIPIKSINGSLSNAGISNMQIVVPNGLKYGAEISARSNGGFIITAIEFYSDGTQSQTDFGEFKITRFPQNRGARSYSITVAGEMALARMGGNTVTVQGQSTLNNNSGVRSLNCGLDKDLLPSDTVIGFEGVSFKVARIGWLINESSQRMDVYE